MTVYLTTPFFILFFRIYIPQRYKENYFSCKPRYRIHFSLITLLLDTYITTGLVKYFQVLLLFLILYVGYVLIIINSRKREGAIWVAFGLIVFLGTLINDLLYLNNFIYTGFYFHWGYSFLSSRTFYFIYEVFKAFTTVESMSEKLGNS